MFQVERAYKFILYSSLIIYIVSLIWGLLFTQEDFVQGNSYRIIYLHVPASFLSQSLYIAMAVASFVYIVWRVKLAAYLVISIAPIGALTTFIALYIWINLGNTYMGYLVAMGCKNYFNSDSFYYVFRLDFIAQFIQQL